MCAYDVTYDFRYLKERVRIGTLLRVHGLDRHLKRRGHRLQGPCPLHHGDNRTAFRVDLQRDLWRCFTSCGGGDVVDLTRRILGCDHSEAARHLRGLLCDPARLPALPAPVSLDTASKPVKALFRPFTFTIPLDPRHAFLQHEKGVAVATARRFEAGWTNRSSFLRSTVAVRLHDLQGRPLGYCGRRLDPHDVYQKGKWCFPKGYPKAETLFNAHRAASSPGRGIVVVEGPWAVLRLAQAGVPRAVALLGTRMSNAHARWLTKAPVVLLLLDGDSAGRRGAKTIAAALRGTTAVRIYELPDGAEPEDLADDEMGAIAHRLLLL